jgi:hypothetical protein
VVGSEGDTRVGKMPSEHVHVHVIDMLLFCI